jgi:NADH-quinone oxidoreductase subunit N
MLAYSSIAHAGYLLVALWPGSSTGLTAVVVYLVGYVATSLAAFGILTVLGRDGEREVTLDSIAGLARQRPWLSFGLAVAMLSLLGMPGTLGFIGKWAILGAVVQERHYALAVVLVVTTLVSAGYYLPVVMSAYMRDPVSEHAHDGATLPSPAALVVTASVILVLLFGVLPSGLVAAATATAGSLIGR